MRTTVLTALVTAGLFTTSWSLADEAATSRPATTRPASTQPAKLSDKRVIIDTSLGKITIELTPDKTPITVKNFLAYVDEKFFDDLVFHRVIKTFMIQGGGFDKELKQKETHSPIKNESAHGLSNTRGTIAMARTRDPDSATAQFFINTGDNKFLDRGGGGYAAFGKVVEGMDVVDKIASVPCKPGQFSAPGDPPSQPVDPVMIKSIRRAPATADEGK